MYFNKQWFKTRLDYMCIYFGELIYLLHLQISFYMVPVMAGVIWLFLGNSL